MGNLINTIKKFIGNKNTVTILAVIAGVLVLWWFYNYRVDQAITTISVPYAINKVDSGKKIESDNIGFKDITQSSLKDSDMITNMSGLEGKYICTGTSIPVNGFFYSSQVCDKNQIKNSIFDDIRDGYTIYTLSVDSKATYADSILPGDYIDLYVRTNESEGTVFKKLIEWIEVLAVRDSSGRDLFWDSEAGTGAYLLFAVPDEINELLNVAEMNSIDVSPVPRSASYSKEEKETKVADESLKNYIMSKKAAI